MRPDKTNNTTAQRAPTDPRQTPAEVRQLLNVIAGQIASAEFKSSVDIDDIKVRLQALQQQAQAARADAQGDLAHEYERIEASLAELTSLVPEPQDGPAALRSAASGWTGAQKSLVNQADPFDMVDNGTAWSESDAEQLTQVYEEIGLVPEGLSVASVPAPVSAPLVAQPAPAVHNFQPAEETPAHQAATAFIGSNEVTQPWLEDRFADIAAGLETIMHETHPSITIAALDDRLSKLEVNLKSVLQPSGAPVDVAALEQIQNQISDVALQFEKAQSQFDRIETIETQLNAVVDHLAAQLELQPGSPQPVHDLQRLVEDAAEMTAQRFASAQPLAAMGAGSSGDIDGLKSMLEAYVTDRRQSDEHNALMLDTVQQALIRVLDRIDSLEASHEKTLSQVTSKSHSPTYSAPQMHAESAPPPGGMERRSNERRAPGLEDGYSPSRPVIQVADDSFGELPASPAVVGSEKLRQDFVADAQRARQRAASMRSDLVDDDGLAIAAVGIATGAAASATRSRVGAPAAAAVEMISDQLETAAAPASGLASRKNLLIGVAAALALFVGLSMVKKYRAKTAALTTPAIEMTEPVAEVGQSSAKIRNDGAPAKSMPNAKTSTQQMMPGGSTPPPTDKAPSPQSSLEFDNPDTVESVNKVNAFDTELPGLRLRAPDTTQSVAEISLLQQQHKLAEMSNKLGETTANVMTPAAFMQEVPVTRVPSPTTTAAQGSSSALDLPPVTVGPLSMRLAAANGDPSAEFEAGSRLAEGKGTNQDFKEAMRWYQRSASKGFAQAQYRLGTMYERGLGTKADLGMARNWYQRAAEQGNIKAMHNLAVLNAGRQNGNPDYAAASKWFKEAALRDLKDSQYNLAVLYENGLGVEKDQKQAVKWFSLAARSNDAESVKRRDAAKAQLAPAELAQVSREIAAYKPIFETDLAINDPRAAGEEWKKRARAAEKPVETAASVAEEPDVDQSAEEAVVEPETKAGAGKN